MKKRVSKFKNEDEERDFWSKKDSSEYLNWKDAERKSFANLEPSAEETILPGIDDFDALIQQARKQAEKAGLKKKDIRSAVAKARRRKSKQNDDPQV